MGFESTVWAGEWPQTYALDRAATGIDIESLLQNSTKYEQELETDINCRLHRSRVSAGSPQAKIQPRKLQTK